MIISIIEQVYSLLWGDLIMIPLPGGGSLGISLLVLLLIPTGIYFTIRTKFLPLRLFPDMVKSLLAKKEHKDSLSTFQTLIVSTAFIEATLAQLYCDDHADCAAECDRGQGRNGSPEVCDALSSWRVWCDIYRDHIILIQFFDIPRNLILC